VLAIKPPGRPFRAPHRANLRVENPADRRALRVPAPAAWGEEVAIGLLRDERTTLRESFDGFSFTRLMAPA
jgi:hypothetical protein